MRNRLISVWVVLIVVLAAVDYPVLLNQRSVTGRFGHHRARRVTRYLSVATKAKTTLSRRCSPTTRQPKRLNLREDSSLE